MYFLTVLLCLSLIIIWQNRQARVYFGFMLAGVISNCIDVFTTGGVRDYLPWFNYQTNLADIIIWLGLLLTLKSLIWQRPLLRP